MNSKHAKGPLVHPGRSLLPVNGVVPKLRGRPRDWMAERSKALD